VPYHYLKFLPFKVNLVLNQLIHGNGEIGVLFLFILSGFLMAYLYPNPPSKLQFLQKRYTRIFPLFLTLCLIRLTINFSGRIMWLKSLMIVFLLALMVHILWVFGIRRINKPFLSRSLFVAFLLLQILVGTSYIIFSRIGNSPYLPHNLFIINQGITGLVNATLTFPLGSSYPALDTVYWTLSVEIIFYILYAIICVPLIKKLTTAPRIIKIFILFVLIPIFFYGNSLIGHVLRLDYIHVYLFYYFVTGMSLGYLYRKHPDCIQKMGKLFSSWLYLIPVLLFVSAIAYHHYIIDFIAIPPPLVDIYFALPYTLLISLALTQENVLSKFFSSKLLVFLGIISYSIYLSHMVVNETIHSFFIPHKT